VSPDGDIKRRNVRREVMVVNKSALILILIVPVGVYQLCVENNNRLQPTLFYFMFLLKQIYNKF
jgi:hypothetical protein